MSENIQLCEVVTDWGRDGDESSIVFCGKVAVRRYHALGGGFMYLCLRHGKQHVKYSEPCYAGEES